MSLRTGGLVATAEDVIINPNNLKVEGWYCQDAFTKHRLVLLSQEVRDIVPQGLAVNDHEDLSEPGELIRLQEIMTLKFELLGKPVYTDSKRKLGKVSDYAVDMKSLFVQKLYISQPVYRSLAGGQLSIDRTQIVEITNKQIIVRDVEIKVTSPLGAAVGVN